MIKIITIDKEGNPVKGTERNVSKAYWDNLQKIKNLRWKEVKSEIKKEENGNERTKRSATGSVVKKAGS